MYRWSVRELTANKYSFIPLTVDRSLNHKIEDIWLYLCVSFPRLSLNTTAQICLLAFGSVQKEF